MSFCLIIGKRFILIDNNLDVIANYLSSYYNYFIVTSTINNQQSTMPLPSLPGTYIIFMQLLQPTSIQVGKLGLFDFNQSYYCYIGSAFGPGGLKARVNRHILKNKKKRWHIDYIREEMNIVKVWYSTQPVKIEFSTVEKFKKTGCVFPIKGFGSSGCKCLSHLIQLDALPNIIQFNNLKTIPTV